MQGRMMEKEAGDAGRGRRCKGKEVRGDGVVCSSAGGCSVLDFLKDVQCQVLTCLRDVGASPFMENGRSLTSVDLAINLRSAALVRRLETRAPFYGLMLLKVPKYMGLGSEWKSRWCVMMPRLPNPHPGLRQADKAVRTLLVCYKVCLVRLFFRQLGPLVF